MRKLRELFKISIQDTNKFMFPKFKMSIASFFKIIIYVGYFILFFSVIASSYQLSRFIVIVYILANILFYYAIAMVGYLIFNIPLIFFYTRVDKIIAHVDSFYTSNGESTIRLSDDLTFNYRDTYNSFKELIGKEETLEVWKYYLETTKIRIGLISSILVSFFAIYIGFIQTSPIVKNNSSWRYIDGLFDPTVVLIVKVISTVLLFLTVYGKIGQINHTKERIDLIIKIISK